MRGLQFLTILVFATATSACQQYYEGRIDKLYARCDVPKMPPHALEECLDQTRKLAASYSSPRLDTLLAQLERSAEPQPPPPPTEATQKEEGVGSGYGDNEDAGADRSGYASANREGEDAYDDEPFQPDYDSVPPREPEPPADPD